MKKQKLKNYLKIGILSFGITLLTTNCQKDDNLETKVSELKSHSLDEMTLTDFLNSNPYQTFKETVPNKGGNNLSYRSINPKNDYEFNSSKVLTTNLDGEKTYNAAIRKTDGSDQDYNLNLMIKENSLDTRTYIVKHAKDGSNIIIQPVNFSPNIPTTPDGYSCVGVGWSATTPCPCAGHTSSSSCSCSTPPNHTSGTITVCWDEPIVIPNIPIGRGGTHIAIGGNAGGPGEPIKHTQPPKIYIYEGEEQCFSSGECTPPLYWAQVVAENENIDEFIEDSFFDDQIFIDQDFKDNLCLKSVYDAMGKATAFNNYLQNFDSDMAVADLRFTADDNFGDNFEDYTNAMAITSPPINSNEIIITFNTDTSTTGDITDKPDVFKAVAMIHELLHAEMYRKMLDAVRAAEISGNNLNWANWTSEQFYNDFLDSLENKYFGIFDYFTRYNYGISVGSNPNDWQHEQMAEHYRDVIKQALTDYDSTLTNAQKDALSWIGLNEANIKAWQSLTQPERDTINNTITQIKNTFPNGCN